MTVTTVRSSGASPTWPHYDAPTDTDHVVVHIDGEGFTFTRKDALRFANQIRSVVGVKEIPA